ncbi:MAG: hypothetical protein ACRDV3_05155 [Acidothermaceae bacterium]
MRWHDLFDDLEAQYGAARDAELASEISDRTRRELALVRLIDRLRPAIGQPVSVRLLGAAVIEGELTAVGPDWLLLTEIAGREALVATHAVLSIGGLAAQSANPDSEGKVSARLTLAFALRAIVRDRSAVMLSYLDGSTTTGTLDRVGADFVEIAEHAPGEERRRQAVRGVRTVPLGSLALVRRALTDLSS